MYQSDNMDYEEIENNLIDHKPEPFVSTKGVKRVISKRKKKLLTAEYKSSVEKFKEYLELRYSKSTIQQYLWAYEKYGWKINSQRNLDDFMIYISHQRNNNPLYLGFIKSYIECFELPYKITKSKKRNIGVSKPIKYFTKEEIDKMIKKLPKKMGLIVRLYAETGLRLNELIKTHREKINLDKREIIGIGKGNKPFRVYYSEKTNELMKLLLTHNNNDYPFITKSDSKDPGRLFYYHFRKELEKIGLKGHPHMIRHYIGHYLRTVKKWDLQQIKVKLRHSRLETTGIYTEATEEEVRQKMEKEVFEDAEL